MAAQRVRWATEHNVAVAREIAPKTTTTTTNPLVKAEPKATLSDMERRWQLIDVRRKGHIPYWWTAATAATGTLGWGLSELFGATVSSGAATVTGLTVGGAAAGVHGVARLAKRRQLDVNKLRFTLASAASSTWITLTSLVGVSWWQMAVLGVSSAAIGAGYKRQLRHERDLLMNVPPPVHALPTPAPRPDLDEPIEPAEPDLPGEYVARWNTHIGCTGGVLEGSTLAGMHTTDLGVEGIVNLRPAKHTLQAALGAVPQVRSGLYLSADDGEDDPGEEVLFDQPGRSGGTRLSANQLRIQIVAKSPVKKSPFFERPLYADGQPGTALIGLYADGRGHAPWILYDNDGVWSGFICAGTGGGKSSLMDVLAVSVRGTGVMNTMFLDPQGGASSPTLVKNCSILALGEAQIVPALRALESIASARETYLNAHGLPALVPGKPVECPPGCPCGGVVPPGLMVFIDECDQVFDRKEDLGGTVVTLGDRFGTLAKRIRKLGVGFICASQYSGLKVFGNSELLRSNIATKNLAAFRTTSNQGGKLIPGLPVDPKTLPRRAGYGIVAGEDTRTAPMRALWAPRRGKDEHVNPPAFVDDVIAQYPEPPVHRIDTASIRGLLAPPESAAQHAQTTAMTRLSQLMGSNPSSPSSPVATVDTVAAVTSGGRTGGIFTVPAPVAHTERPVFDMASLSETDRAVVEVLRDGRGRTREIVEACGIDNPATRGRINRAIRSLTDKGWVVDGGHGRWQLTESAYNACRPNAA
ncbi:TrmB family transcriptional regulator [Prauserella endophytica]|uniref:TrmB family transcriptional regulator n=1 Tax=Prauserella endophytica TaxID=1592324 RepID=A0ABY2RV20_9PSEU|nr:TrmB family transcriptional regulator [Prauserella endophytica]TKG61558.1 TrmB family transcriptional regulator [Prauserella endophytica]